MKLSRVTVALAGAVVLWAVGGCNSSSGTTGSVGATGSGGATGDGGTTASGGAPGAGGSTASGGTTGSGGTNGSGGTIVTGGGATGGVTASGGSTGAGGATTTGGTHGGGSGGSAGTDGAAYQGPCDVVPGGCAEAYGLTRAMTASYTGPLFQLARTSDKTTLDIGQTASHTADLSTWSSFCGGNQSNCVITKLYAQIHRGPNDLVPAIWKAPWGPDCSAAGFTCAAKFTIEAATGLPILTTVAPQEYALSGDGFSTGITAGKTALGIFYNGKPVANTTYCCGLFGLTHKYNAPDTFGTDFMVTLGYGWKNSGGNGVGINCAKSNTYCVGAEEEENNDLGDYGTSPVANALVVTQFDPTANAVSSYLNGTQQFSHSPPKAALNVSTAIHLGGGGDLSQPDPILMREAFMTNAVMSSATVTALKANAVAFYPALSFP